MLLYTSVEKQRLRSLIDRATYRDTVHLRRRDLFLSRSESGAPVQMRKDLSPGRVLVAPVPLQGVPGITNLS